jgi:hypothetical protein
MYLYHAHALALGGTFVRPFQQTIDSQAACSLSSAGGTGSARSEKFNFNNLISFDFAKSDVTGGVEKRNGTDIHVTRVSVVVEGLNILNMFTADRVVARLASEHDPKTADEPSIITTGSHFDNLKIAGHPVQIDYGHDLFHKYHTFAALQKGFDKDNADGELTKCLMGSTFPVQSSDPQNLQEVCQGFAEQKKALPKLKSTVLCSCVKKVNGLNGSEIRNWGNIISVPQFGTIYLGEVIVSPGYRSVSMFRLSLGSPDGGTLIGPTGGGNGLPYP